MHSGGVLQRLKRGVDTLKNRLGTIGRRGGVAKRKDNADPSFGAQETNAGLL